MAAIVPLGFSQPVFQPHHGREEFFLPRGFFPLPGCSPLWPWVWGGCSGHCLAGGAARGDVEALQHPAEHGIGEQVCKERGELEQILFSSQAPLKGKKNMVLGWPKRTFSFGGFGDLHPWSCFLPVPSGCT